MYDDTSADSSPEESFHDGNMEVDEEKYFEQKYCPDDTLQNSGTTRRSFGEGSSSIGARATEPVRSGIQSETFQMQQSRGKSNLEMIHPNSEKGMQIHKSRASIDSQFDYNSFTQSTSEIHDGQFGTQVDPASHYNNQERNCFLSPESNNDRIVNASITPELDNLTIQDHRQVAEAPFQNYQGSYLEADFEKIQDIKTEGIPKPRKKRGSEAAVSAEGESISLIKSGRNKPEGPRRCGGYHYYLVYVICMYQISYQIY